MEVSHGLEGGRFLQNVKTWGVEGQEVAATGGVHMCGWGEGREVRLSHTHMHVQSLPSTNLNLSVGLLLPTEPLLSLSLTHTQTWWG